MPDVATSYTRFSGLIGPLEILVFDTILSSNFHKFFGKFMKMISTCHPVVCNCMLNLCKRLCLRQYSFLIVHSFAVSKIQKKKRQISYKNAILKNNV